MLYRVTVTDADNRPRAYQWYTNKREAERAAAEVGPRRLVVPVEVPWNKVAVLAFARTWASWVKS
jgi:hypothetical protein